MTTEAQQPASAKSSSAWKIAGLILLTVMLSVGITLWLVFAVLYDGLVLAVTVWYQDYPLETATIAMVTANPIDLARIIVMLTFDYAALMGYTGAVFQKFFGEALGILVSATSLALWTVIPFTLGARAFKKKDW